jgi:hypothetical protein
LRRVSKDGREIGASWFETREAALLTMRIRPPIALIPLATADTVPRA